MDYIVVGIAALALVVFLIIRLGGAAGRRPARGAEASPGRPVMVEQPAADEPTPGRSETAGPKQADEASRRTPPA
ncbi:MAG TPA: hypothetical protein VHC86_10380 [Opitutaceae bacterium]|nr:hypothetical protein [Opitutaceae bacterium]